MKAKRQKAIIDLVESRDIETQEELSALLQQQGFNTTQATISRDIRELGLTKVTFDRGRHKYTYERAIERSGKTNGSYEHVLKNGIVSIDSSENIIVIKTVSGMAMAVGAAIDNISLEGIMGCIAGDDTLFLAIRKREQSKEIINSIKEAASLNDL